MLLGYPLCTHLAMTRDIPNLQVFALCLLVASVLFEELRAGRGFAWGMLGGFFLGGLLLREYQGASYVLYLPPIVLPCLMFMVFRRSLDEGEVPLVTRIGEAVHGPFCPRMRSYTRRVTQLWCFVFVFLAVMSALLALFASAHQWSWFTNFLFYLLIGVIFLLEFFVRRMRFRDFDHPAFSQYLKIVVRADYRGA